MNLHSHQFKSPWIDVNADYSYSYCAQCEWPFTPLQLHNNFSYMLGYRFWLWNSKSFCKGPFTLSAITITIAMICNHVNSRTFELMWMLIIVIVIVLSVNGPSLLQTWDQTITLVLAWVIIAATVVRNQEPKVQERCAVWNQVAVKIVYLSLITYI